MNNVSSRCLSNGTKRNEIIFLVADVPQRKHLDLEKIYPV
jgi:hypothetical protein